ncbi:hypothetical protein Tco_1218615 [Tanacetum coccineum]
MTRIESLEKEVKELQHTKTTYGSAIVTLVKRVKTLEVALKIRSKRVVVSESEDEEPKDQGRNIQHDQNDPLVSLVQGLVTPTKTAVNTSGEELVEDISPNTLEAAKTLSKVASLVPTSMEKGKIYVRRKELKAKRLNTDFEVSSGFEEVKSGFEEVSSGGINVSSGFKEVNAGDMEFNADVDPVVTDSTKVSIPSPPKV